ncbi:MAG: ferritin family protein [Spirochaetales bacterium]|nr:ferritin family protein [Spirochaetales bacterium]
MSSGEMNVTDILKYSIRIEHESMNFYRESAAKVDGQAVKELLAILEQEEIKHEQRLTDILASADNTAVSGLDTESMDKLIQNRSISATTTEREILNTALGREKNTRDFYASIATMTNLNADVADLFQMLYNQESGHVTKVGNLLKKLDG